MTDTPDLLDQRPTSWTAVGPGLLTALAEIAAAGGTVAGMTVDRHHPARYVLKVFYRQPTVASRP